MFIACSLQPFQCYAEPQAGHVPALVSLVAAACAAEQRGMELLLDSDVSGELVAACAGQGVRVVRVRCVLIDMWV